MAPEKSPAFQFYPKDYLSDPRVRSMSFEERGLYWEAISLCWLEGSLPADLAELAAILGCHVNRLKTSWSRIGRCFEVHGERLTHKRLDKERAAQAESRERRTKAAEKRWERDSKADAMQMQCTASEPAPADAKQCSPSSSPSASSSSSPTPVSDHGGGRLITTGVQFQKLQETHAYVGTNLRVPKVLHAELIAKSGANADDELRQWYAHLDADLEQSGKGTGDVFAWLRPRHQAFAISRGWIDAAPKPAKPAYDVHADEELDRKLRAVVAKGGAR